MTDHLFTTPHSIIEDFDWETGVAELSRDHAYTAEAIEGSTLRVHPLVAHAAAMERATVSNFEGDGISVRASGTSENPRIEWRTADGEWTTCAIRDGLVDLPIEAFPLAFSTDGWRDIITRDTLTIEALAETFAPTPADPFEGHTASPINDPSLRELQDSYGWKINPAELQAASDWAKANGRDDLTDRAFHTDKADVSISSERAAQRSLVAAHQAATTPTIERADLVAQIHNANHAMQRPQGTILSRLRQGRARAATIADGRAAAATLAQDITRAATGTLPHSTGELIQTWRTLNAAHDALTTMRDQIPGLAHTDQALTNLANAISDRIGYDWPTLAATADTLIPHAITTTPGSAHLAHTITNGGHPINDGLLGHPDLPRAAAIERLTVRRDEPSLAHGIHEARATAHTPPPATLGERIRTRADHTHPKSHSHHQPSQTRSRSR